MVNCVPFRLLTKCRTFWTKNELACLISLWMIFVYGGDVLQWASSCIWRPPKKPIWWRRFKWPQLSIYHEEEAVRGGLFLDCFNSKIGLLILVRIVWLVFSKIREETTVKNLRRRQPLVSATQPRSRSLTTWKTTNTPPKTTKSQQMNKKLKIRLDETCGTEHVVVNTRTINPQLIPVTWDVTHHFGALADGSAVGRASGRLNYSRRGNTRYTFDYSDATIVVTNGSEWESDDLPVGGINVLVSQPTDDYAEIDRFFCGPSSERKEWEYHHIQGDRRMRSRYRQNIYLYLVLFTIVVLPVMALLAKLGSNYYES